MSAPADSPPPGRDERTLAAFFWVIDIGLHVVGPWLLWRLTRRGSAYLNHHAKACVNHTITVLVLILGSCVVFGAAGWVCSALDHDVAALALLAVPFATLAGMALFSLVVHVIGALRARAGVWYTPPLCWRWVK